MEWNEILAFVRDNPLAFLATCEGTAPHVRGVMVLRADEHGILFNTGRNKDLHKQLAANPQAEMCFYGAKDNVQVRVEGRLEIEDTEDNRALILEKLPFLKPVVEQHGFESLAPYVMKHGRATVWTMQTNFEPKRYIEF